MSAAPVREPGELVQMDLKEPPRAAQGLRSLKYYQFTAIDKATGLKFARLYDDKSVTSSVDFLSRAVEFFPFPIRCVQTDNGTEFTYWFMKGVRKEHPFGTALHAANIDHRLIPVYNNLHGAPSKIRTCDTLICSHNSASFGHCCTYLRRAASYCKTVAADLPVVLQMIPNSCEKSPNVSTK